MPAVELYPIGHVRTAYRRLADTPIQTARNPDEAGRVDLLDGTPVLDIKPFEPHFDVPGYADGTARLDHLRRGWYARDEAAANLLVRPGRRGLEAAGLTETPEDPEETLRPASGRRPRGKEST